jgi:general secretion pathway protein K
MSSDNEAGFAVPLAVAMMALFAVFCSQFLIEARAARRSESSQFEVTEDHYAAEGAIYRVIYALLYSNDSYRAPLDGAPIEVLVGTDRVRVRARSETGKIDVSRSSTGVLAALFRSLGQRPDEALALAQRIVAWRTSAGGINDEATAYEAAGRGYAPPFEAFRTIEDVNLILGMSDDLAAKMPDAATVQSSDGSVDRSLASDAVLQALASTSDSLAQAELDARKGGAARKPRRRAAPGEVISISATVSDKRHPIGCEALVAFRWDNARPFELLSLRWATD